MAFIDQGKFEAMKTLSGWEAARCDEHPFHAKIKVSTEQRKKERIRKMALLLTRTFVFICLPRGYWPLMSLADQKGTQRGSLDA